SIGSRIRRASSGSRSASSSIELLRSAKRTVTCFRSPSIAVFDVRIFSARRRGVYESGEANRVLASPAFGGGPIGWPHFLQKLCERALTVPQATQASASFVPHSGQKSASGGDGCWHRGHVILCSNISAM